MIASENRLISAEDILKERELLGSPLNDRADKNAEEVLTKLGIEFHYETIDLSLIDWNISRRNRGRGVEKDDAICLEYAEAMRRGDRFPAICCRKIGALYQIAGGYHRAIAKGENSDTECLALVFASSDAVFTLICVRLNAVEGVRTSAGERIAQAAMLVTQHSWSASEAAKHLSVADTSVNNFLKRQELAASLSACGMSSASIDNLSDVKLRAIGGLYKCPLVMLEIAKLAVADNTMSPEDIRTYVREIEKIPAESDRLLKVSADQKTAKTTSRQVRTTIRRGKHKQFMMAVGSLESLISKLDTTSKLQINEEELPQLKKRWQALSKKISTILSG